MFTYRTHGTCSQQILLDIDENDIIRKLEFVGGCRGNTQGIARLVVGMNVDEVISRCKGILCQPTTSCPDQLARALEQYKAQKGALQP